MLGQKKKEVVLRVEEPDPSHVGRNIITLDKRTKEELGVTSGDIVEIEGTKKTAAVIWPARAEDEGKAIIRMDNLIRHNAGTGLGEKVTIRRAIYAEAKRVVLAPTQEVRIIASGYDRILKKNFIGRPLAKGDNVWISVFGSGFVYKVVETAPKGIVKITDFTQFILREEPVKDEVDQLQKISYEDIGGLEEQVQKIREMIELPLRHPEIFTKLGINAPKGVLLHGPPGTGKTLLAKAVANETQAHFIAVNSPAVMCVGGGTRILTNPHGGKAVKELFLEAEKTGKTIKDGKMKIIELKKPGTVFSLDKNLKIKQGKITHITRLKAKTFRIKTGLEEEIVCSENHPFACMDSFGSIVWKTAKELSRKDLIAIAKTLPEGKTRKFNYLKNFDAGTWIRTKKGVMKLGEFKGKQKEITGIKIASKRRKIKEHEFTVLPNKSSPELLRILGLMYSEGNLQQDGLQFANRDEILKQEFANLAKKLFGITPKIKKEKVFCYSVALKHFFEKTLQFPPIGKKGNYSLPEWIFGLTKKETMEFLTGFLEGDGTTSKGTGGYPTIRFYSITRNVLEDLSILCRKLGIITKIVPWKTEFSDMLALVVVGNRSREIFAEQAKSNTEKFSIIKKWYAGRKKTGDDLRIPNISPLLKQVKQKNNYFYGKNLPEGPTERYISGRDYLTQRKLEEITQFMPDARLQKLAKAQVSWTKIENIKQEGNKELFDLSVEPYSNFLAGHSLLVMHNSKFVGEAEERIRDVFKEAEKNSPSIVFFDEIDSIAPKREEVIGEVERRVVAQILAAMDGMESRGNVIVIAATNRVNSLDEALRRPGRFDREIEIGVPSKEGRKKILQIHTRGMPLAEDVDLDNFAKITHGFVGADLEALAKEAAMKALRRYLPKINLEEETIPAEVLESLEVNKQDFLDALRDVQPSALREVTIEIPNIQWNDIGGLENVKNELRQAVEWPLKRPDDFKKLGIKAPSGILLYGPPGTGKTLLAKAVATESEANFISVKGPQLISLWVGESLPYEEELLVFDGKKIFREKIGKIVEEKLPLQVVTFDNDGRVLFSKIVDYISHPLNGKMLEITTRTGRKLRVTDKHSVFSLVENEIESVTPDQLVNGKSVIAIPAKLPNVSIENQFLNLPELFSKKEKYFIESPQIVESIKKTGYTVAAKLLHKKTKFLYEIVDKKLPVSLASFLLLLKSAELAPQWPIARISRKGARHSLPALLPLDEFFWEMTGLWIAEGEFNNEMLRFTAADQEIRTRLLKAIAHLGLQASQYEYSIVINSTTLHDVFVEMGLKSGAFNKKIPGLLFTSNNVQTNAFLRGYFSGDGTFRFNGHSAMVESSTTSKTLANDLLYLLLKQGIVAFCRTKKEWTGSISFRVQIFGVENLKKFQAAGFIDSHRNNALQNYIMEVQWKRGNAIPVNEKIKNLLREAFVSYANNQTVSLRKVREALVMVDSQKQQYSELWKLCESDIYWDLVKKIVPVEYTDNVFDVSVEPCQNFIAGFGGIFAHNSERGIRKVFHRARQVSPTIIFFDEIDAMASMRGQAFDSGTNERVVNQLLTELDGIEELKDVVFIAATNRPDLIDPGLLRPGRIDKIIMIGAPDEKARLSILKVHTKKTPLGKDVRLEEIARKTEGYSGADLQGVIREAALIAIEKNRGKTLEVTKSDIDTALEKIPPSISMDVMNAYDQFRKNYSTIRLSYVR
ncbi:MAG: AAA family ATPase [Candidatus Diapherotrites archaeon]|nr:AAA family ATPase [Candidatus Diapherotrites archaeon]